MAVTGGIKFFEGSKFLFKDGNIASDMRGETSNTILNYSRDDGWISKNPSDDTTKEQIIIEGVDIQKITRIILNDHNFKDVTIYLLAPSSILQENDDFLLQENGDQILEEADTFSSQAYNRFIIIEDGSFLLQDQNPDDKFQLENFSTFVAIPTADYLQRTITDSNITTSTSYFEFDETRVTDILIEVTTTQTVDVQKTLKSFIATNEIGTLNGFPQISKTHSRNSKEFNALSGRAIVRSGRKNLNLGLSFNGFKDPDDATLIETLFESDNSFIVWLCGGQEGSPYYDTTIDGYDIDDLYLMKNSQPLPYSYLNSVTTNPFATALQLIEVAN